MPPKYSSCFTDLLEELSIQINYDNISECSSISSNLTLRKLGQLDEEEFSSHQVLHNKMQ